MSVIFPNVFPDITEIKRDGQVENNKEGSEYVTGVIEEGDT